SVRFTTAPVGATGSVLFVSVNPALQPNDPVQCYSNLSLCSGSVELAGFTMGDESTVSLLAISQVMQASRNAGSGAPAPARCIGCHTGLPGGDFVSFSDHYPWRAAVASVLPGSTGAQLPTLTAGGFSALMQPGWGPFTYTVGAGGAFWSDGRKIGVAS